MENEKIQIKNRIKLLIKKILIIGGIIGVVISVLINIYFGLTKIKNKIYQAGLRDGASSIVQQIRNGSKINFKDGVIIFIPNQNENHEQE